MTLASIRRSLDQHRPRSVEADGATHAAVALIFRELGREPEFLAIQRAERAGDPWSGHMALPGGRREPSDPSPFATAVREAKEEVGIDLADRGRMIGQLDELQAVGGGKVLPLIITPIACEVREPITLAINTKEVREAVWIPLSALTRSENQGHFSYEIEGFSMRHPAIVYGGYTIWGLTYRILHNLLQVLA